MASQNADHIRRALQDAPPLTDQQRAEIARALAPQYDHAAALRRRRDAAKRLPPLVNGVRDPWSGR